MKAFIAGTAAVIVIAIAALFALETMQSDTAASLTTQNVRLPTAQ